MRLLLLWLLGLWLHCSLGHCQSQAVGTDVNSTFFQLIDKYSHASNIVIKSEIKGDLKHLVESNSATLQPLIDSLIWQYKRAKKYPNLTLLFYLHIINQFIETNNNLNTARTLLNEYASYLKNNDQYRLMLELECDAEAFFIIKSTTDHKALTKLIREILLTPYHDLAADILMTQAQLYAYDNIKGYSLSMAYKNVKQALEIIEKYHLDSLLRAKAYHNLSFIYYTSSEYSKAAYHARQAIEIYKKYKLYNNSFFRLNNILALVYRKLNLYDSSLSAYETALKYMPYANQKVWEGIYYGNIGTAYLLQKKYEKAIEYFRKSIPLSRKYREVENFTESYIKLADALLALDRLKEVQATLDTAQAYIQSNRFSLHTIQLFHEVSMKYYLKINDKARVSQEFEKYKTIQDSIDRRRQRDNINETALILEMQDIEKELHAVSKEKELKEKNISLYNNLLIMSVVLLTIITAASFALFRLYQKLQKANQVLQKTNDSKNRLFSILAHDLRSPLAVLITGLRMLEQPAHKHTTEEEALITSLRKVSENFLVMLDNTLYWARSQMGGISVKKEPFAPAKKLAPEINNAKELAAAKDITLDVQIPEHLMITSDVALLSIITRNLLSNAIKFTNKHGLITITLAACPNSEKGKWSLTVSDNGIGMNEEQLNNLFILKNKKSLRGTDGEKGTGMGMVLVKELVELIEGRIVVTSKPGEGTTVTCYFG